MKWPRCHSAAKVSVSNRANKANKMDLQLGLVGAQQAIAKVVLNNLVEPFGKYHGFYERSWPEGAMEQVAVKAAQEPFCPSIRLPFACRDAETKGLGLLLRDPGMSSSIETGFDKSFHWMIYSPFISIYYFFEKTVKLKNGNSLFDTLQKTGMAIENHHA